MKCEGYLFPETYEFLKGDTVHNYVETFYAKFDAQITDAMYAKLKEQGMTLNELVTLASFVQEMCIRDSRCAEPGRQGQGHQRAGGRQPLR